MWAIRSYAYLLLHAPSVQIARKFMPWDKVSIARIAFLVSTLIRMLQRPAFFVLRLTFATVSSFIETAFYRSAVDNLNPRLGRYLLFSLLLSAAMYSSTTNFLPSTFAMWGVMFSASYSLKPVDGGLSRIAGATFGIAAASIVGWPFSALLGVPLVLEQLFVRGKEKVEKGKTALWAANRARKLAYAVIVGASLAVSHLLLPRLRHLADRTRRFPSF